MMTEKSTTVVPIMAAALFLVGLLAGYGVCSNYWRASLVEHAESGEVIHYDADHNAYKVIKLETKWGAK